VTLKDGRQRECVYLVEEESYLEVWGVYPEDDAAKSSVRIEDVADLAESPRRLPAELADKLYRSGESGMGYMIFTVAFRDGGRLAVVTGNAVDFIPLPPDKTWTDIEDVLPHVGRDAPDLTKAPDYCWCIYSGIGEKTAS
jgi:hypothetical protein